MMSDEGTVCGSKVFNKFQTFEGSQYFSPDLREKDSLLIRFQKKEE